MQFKVPQFLDIEDKIFGPFTFRQFIYLAGGAGLCFVLYRLLGFLLAIIPILLIGGLAAALTFYRPNNKPFINMLEAGFKYFTQNKLYIWEKDGGAETGPQAAIKKQATVMAPHTDTKLTGGKLRDLAWSLDVLDLSKQKES
jgi:hypothetical protein